MRHNRSAFCFIDLISDMTADSCQPLPRTSLEPVCEAEAGLSLSQLAERTRLSRQMLSFVESGERIPTIDTAARISRALDMRLSRLALEAEQHQSVRCAIQRSPNQERSRSVTGLDERPAGGVEKTVNRRHFSFGPECAAGSRSRRKEAGALGAVKASLRRLIAS